jgi:hypothetical protein
MTITAKLLAAALRAAADVLDDPCDDLNEDLPPTKRPRGRPRKNPVDQTPVDQTPVDQTPVDQAPVDQAPVDQAPLEDHGLGAEFDVSDDEMKAALNQASERVGRKRVMELCHWTVGTVRVADMDRAQRAKLLGELRNA